MAVPDDSTVPDSVVAVPEPSSVLSLGIVALAGTILKGRTKRKGHPKNKLSHEQ